MYMHVMQGDHFPLSSLEAFCCGSLLFSPVPTTSSHVLSEFSPSLQLCLFPAVAVAIPSLLQEIDLITVQPSSKMEPSEPSSWLEPSSLLEPSSQLELQTSSLLVPNLVHESSSKVKPGLQLQEPSSALQLSSRLLESKSGLQPSLQFLEPKSQPSLQSEPYVEVQPSSQLESSLESQSRSNSEQPGSQSSENIHRTLRTLMNDFVDGSSAHAKVKALLFGEAGGKVGSDEEQGVVLERMARALLISLSLSVSTLQSSTLRRAKPLVGSIISTTHLSK